MPREVNAYIAYKRSGYWLLPVARSHFCQPVTRRIIIIIIPVIIIIMTIIVIKKEQIFNQTKKQKSISEDRVFPNFVT